MTDIEDDVRVRDAMKGRRPSCGCSPTTFPARSPISTDRQIHVREPGVRELGEQAAGRDLRQGAVRRARGDVRVPAADPQARAAGRERRVRAHRQQRPGHEALDAWPRRTRPRRDRKVRGSIAPNTTSTI